MTKEEPLYQHRCRMFAFYVLRLLEREKEWSADTVDKIADAAFDFSLAITDEGGNFIVKSVDAE